MELLNSYYLNTGQKGTEDIRELEHETKGSVTVHIFIHEYYFVYEHYLYIIP